MLIVDVRAFGHTQIAYGVGAVPGWAQYRLIKILAEAVARTGSHP
jgi:hypothetical protein